VEAYEIFTRFYSVSLFWFLNKNSFDETAVQASIVKQQEKLDKLAEMDAGVQGKLDLLKQDVSSKTHVAILSQKISSFAETGGYEEAKQYFDK
jgi:cell division protein FtsB